MACMSWTTGEHPAGQRSETEGQARRDGNPIYPHRLFFAYLALHAPRSVALADCFSILLEQIADQLDSLFRRGGGMDEMRREIFEQAHSGLVGTQQNHGLLCLQRQRNF